MMTISRIPTVNESAISLDTKGIHVFMGVES